jgi:hypothetical protein
MDQEQKEKLRFGSESNLLPFWVSPFVLWNYLNSILVNIGATVVLINTTVVFPSLNPQ